MTKFLLLIFTSILIVSCSNNTKFCIGDDLLLDKSESENISVYSSRFPNYINTNSGIKYKILSRNTDQISDSITILQNDLLLVNYKVLIDAKDIFKTSKINERFLVKEYGFLLPKLSKTLLNFKIGDSVNIFIPKGFYTYKDEVFTEFLNNDILLSLKINAIVSKYSEFDTSKWVDVSNGIKISFKNRNSNLKLLTDHEKVEMFYAVYIEKNGVTKLVESNFSAINPLQFILKDKLFIEGLNIVLPLLSHGDELKVFIPSNYGYGEIGTNTIPPNSNLIFDIQIE